MKNSLIIYRDIDNIESILTSHKIGEKKVLLSNSETASNVTQIAITNLFAGDRVERHVHLTMDEHYFVLSGEGIMTIDDECYKLDTGKFILVPAGCYHDLSVLSDLNILNFSVSL